MSFGETAHGGAHHAEAGEPQVPGQPGLSSQAPSLKKKKSVLSGILARNLEDRNELQVARKQRSSAQK
jgi:hypothetical protein